MTLDAALEALRGRRVLVTGGGFIGGRLAERLAAEGETDVLVMVRQPTASSAFERVGCRSLVGDVTSRSDLLAAADGCDVIFHCAFGTAGSTRHRRTVNREGTRRVLEAAATAGVRRVVHLSTFMVYGRTVDGDINEEMPRRPFGDPYGDSKLEAEQIALDMARSGQAPVVVLQPVNVYGPHGKTWVENVLARMCAGRITLVNGGTGVCNAVYVDDLVDAMLLAATTDGVVGRALLISSGERVTWREFYDCFEALLGMKRTESRTEAEALADWDRGQRQQPTVPAVLGDALRRRRLELSRLMETREARTVRAAAGEVLPAQLHDWVRRHLPRGESGTFVPSVVPDDEATLQTLTPSEIAFFASRATARIDLARSLLGYEPRFDLEAGMAATTKWVHEAHRIP